MSSLQVHLLQVSITIHLGNTIHILVTFTDSRFTHSQDSEPTHHPTVQGCSGELKPLFPFSRKKEQRPVPSKIVRKRPTKRPNTTPSQPASFCDEVSTILEHPCTLKDKDMAIHKTVRSSPAAPSLVVDWQEVQLVLRFA
jgi:hypothetical protein